MALFPPRLVKSFAKPFTALACVLTVAALVDSKPAEAADPEPLACLSTNPADWPAPSKPYFMFIIDNSGSMTTAVNPGPSCAGYPATRNGHARCAVQNTVRAYSGQVNFGLATYSNRVTDCTGNASCYGGDFGLPPNQGAGCTYVDARGRTRPGCAGGFYCDVNNVCQPEVTCTNSPPPNDDNTCGSRTNDATLTLAGGSAGNNIHQGGYVVVPLLQDNYWTTPHPPSNIPGIEALVDNSCTNGVVGPDGTTVYEIDASAHTPLAGSLFTMNEYFSNTYTDPFTNNQVPPLAVPTPIGTIAEGERGCRPLNVILITDGDETCDCVDGSRQCVRTNEANPTPIAGGCESGQAHYPNTADESIAMYEADRLFHTGVNPWGDNTWAVKTYVIGFSGATTSALDNIAKCGGTNASFSTANETQISEALSTIISSSILPETCDNVDNNCNGCTDEGFIHYCDRQAGEGFPGTCCKWNTLAARSTCTAAAIAGTGPATCGCCDAPDDAARTQCLGLFQASIGASFPQGDPTLLPCTTIAQAQTPSEWLCSNPGEICDNLDNNCELSNGAGTADEGFKKCANQPGDPTLYCPQPEVCDGIDNNCDGNIDEGGVCAGCRPSMEVCDGCDNDCDGVVDNGIQPIPCGPPLTGPNPWCHGTATCTSSGQTVAPGACLPGGGGFGACQNNPQPETCNGIDDDCDGIIDDNLTDVGGFCIPNGTPAGLHYNNDPNNPEAASTCKMGTFVCTNGALKCVGFVGPTNEVCDGLDNDCDGTIDDNLVGLGQACGVNQAPCVPGTTVCVNGSIICSGAIGPEPEICDGIDNDCNGSIDDGLLADAPPAGTGCWDQDPNGCTPQCQWPLATSTDFVPIGTCSDPAGTCAPPAKPGDPCGTGGTCGRYDQTTVPKPLQWCPPAGATCNGLGTLVAPCQSGSLQCLQGAWTCTNATLPSKEVCDGVDNDCNGKVDDNPQDPGIGGNCGSNVGECKFGTTECVKGSLTCVGGVGPTQEICDGKDNDCDGSIDNGLGLGGECWQPYDMNLYPGALGTRQSPPCQPGRYQCSKDGTHSIICVGGVGPQPEVCDGIDNDCDGKIDEPGMAPDGINGTADPGDPTKVIGASCGGGDAGMCTAGNYVCQNAQVICLGGSMVMPEVCDCQDNDCDGRIDNENPGNNPPLCSPGKTCVKAGSSGCQCAVLGCEEIGCPPGQKPENVTNPETGAKLGCACIADSCGDCASKTVMDANGKVICAPAGTIDDCIAAPVCVCNSGQNGCKDPCFGKTCSAGTSCAEVGPDAGKCVRTNCYNIPTCTCGQACHLGTCVETKCDPDPCKANQVCIPNLDPGSKGYTCVSSCKDVDCKTGQRCDQGVCKATCDPACPSGKTCDETQTPPTCVADRCAKDPCSTENGGDGSCCDPLTGACGDCPCSGVVCPMGQVCEDNNCVASQGTGGSGGASSASASATTGSSTTGSAGTGTATTGAGGNTAAGGGTNAGTPNGVFGLATGGGGCQCDIGESEAPAKGLAAAFLAFAVALTRRRRRNERERATVSREVRS